MLYFYIYKNPTELWNVRSSSLIKPWRVFTHKQLIIMFLLILKRYKSRKKTWKVVCFKTVENTQTLKHAQPVCVCVCVTSKCIFNTLTVNFEQKTSSVASINISSELTEINRNSACWGANANAKANLDLTPSQTLFTLDFSIKKQKRNSVIYLLLFFSAKIVNKMC